MRILTNHTRVSNWCNLRIVSFGTLASIKLHNPFYSMSEQEVEEQISSEETLDDETGEDN
jgi:hypothetical protein